MIAVALALLIMLDVPLVHKGDVVHYVDYGHALITNHFEVMAYSIRTYGYPLFLACVVQAANFFNLTSFHLALFAAQFCLHIITATLASMMVRRFPQHRPWIVYAVFAAVAWNPYLLAMITQPLTENLATFWITLFFYLMQTDFLQSNLITRLLMASVLGFAAVTRPFHLVWGFGVMGLFIGVCLWNMWQKIEPISLTPFKRLAQIGLCFALIASTQTLAETIYKLYAWDVPEPPSIDLIGFHHRISLYSYRYETLYDLSQNEVFPALYINQRLLTDASQPESVLMPFIKLVSLFQQHDYKIYRPVMGIVSSGAVAVGLILWTMFCYVIPQSIRELWQAWRSRQAVPFTGLMTIFMALYIGLYVFFTVPESRFIFPILPALVCLFVYYATCATGWRLFLVSLTVATTTYSLAAYTLLWALHAA